MPPLPVIPDTFRTAIEFTQVGVGLVATNIIHVFALGGDINTVGPAVAGALDTDMFAATNSNYEVQSIEMTPLDGTSASQTFPVTGVTGGAPSQDIPNTAAVMSFGTVLRGRSFRGRAYTPGVGEGITQGGVFEFTTLQDMLTAWGNFQATLLGQAIAQVVASYLLNLSNVIVTYVADARNDTQRRRLNRIQT